MGIATRAVAAAFVVTRIGIAGGAEIEQKPHPPAEEPPPPAPTLAPPPPPPPPRFRAIRAASPLTIDGRIDEPAWREAPVYDGFVLNEPTEGGQPSERTELRVVFDDRRVTFAFICYDSRPDTINRSLARRDTEPGSDYVSVSLDADHDRRSALRFYLNAGGVQADTLYYDDIQETQTWDGVWEGAAAMRPDGWSAEISVPLALLGAVAGHDGPWGFLGRRYIARTHEQASSVLVPRAVNARVSLFGDLEGLETVAGRKALSLTPYLAARSVFRRSGDSRLTEVSSDVGADLHATVVDGVILNATVNPDFSQVEADQISLNVSTFETFFPEKRPFFTQELDLFEPVGGSANFGNLQSLFYSRRIGLDTPIFAAGKLTGDGGRFSFGLLDAYVDGGANLGAPDDTGLTYRAERPFHLGPRSELPSVRPVPANFLVGVTRLRLDDANSLGARLAAKSFLRDCPEPCASWGGLAGAVDANLKQEDYALFGQVAGSRIGAGPPRVLADGTTLSEGEYGFGAYLRGGKLGGEPWRLTLGYDVATPRFDLNATGFQRSQNLHHALISTAFVRPSGVGPLHSLELDLDLETSFTSDARRLWLGWGPTLRAIAVIPGFHTVRLVIGGNIGGFDARILERTGVALQHDSVSYYELNFESDATQPFSGTAHAALGRWFGNAGRPTEYDWNFAGSVAWRPIPPVETSLTVSVDRTLFGPRLVERRGADELVLGRLDTGTLSATLRQQWVVTPRLSFQGYAQLFRSRGLYGPYFVARGTPADPIYFDELSPTTSSMDPSFRDTALNLSAVLRWEIHAGETLFVVYSRTQGTHGLVREDPIVGGTLVDGPAVNALAVKYSATIGE